MINYSCDVCGEDIDVQGPKGGSVQHVDRYQVSLDLCGRHLDAWIMAGLEKLKEPEARKAYIQHPFSRAILDALFVVETQRRVPAGKNWTGPAAPDGMRPINPDEAMGAFRLLIKQFKAVETGKDLIGQAPPQDQPGPALHVAKPDDQDNNPLTGPGQEG